MALGISYLAWVAITTVTATATVAVVVKTCNKERTDGDRKTDEVANEFLGNGIQGSVLPSQDHELNLKNVELFSSNDGPSAVEGVNNSKVATATTNTSDDTTTVSSIITPESVGSNSTPEQKTNNRFLQLTS